MEITLSEKQWNHFHIYRGFDAFNSKLKKAFGLESSMFKDSLPTPNFLRFIDVFEMANKDVVDTDSKFQTTLFFRHIMEEMTNDHDLISQNVHFIEKGIPFPPDQQPPRIFMAVSTPIEVDGELEEEFSVDDLLECMTPYFGSDSSSPLFGCLVTYGTAEIVWLDYPEGESLKEIEISRYRLWWTTKTLRNFARDIELKKIDAMPPVRKENLEEFYVFVNFLQYVLINLP